jgi:hypothetical protein
LFAVNKIDQLLRPWQAAGMGGQDMIAADLHHTLLPGDSRARLAASRRVRPGSRQPVACFSGSIKPYVDRMFNIVVCSFKSKVNQSVKA